MEGTSIVELGIWLGVVHQLRCEVERARKRLGKKSATMQIMREKHLETPMGGFYYSLHRRLQLVPGDT